MMPGFPATAAIPNKTTTEGFLRDYEALLRSGSSEAVLVQWLLTNAKENMSKTIFSDSKVDWKTFQPHEVMLLRACAPIGVFAPENAQAYLAKVEGNSELMSIVDALFGEDNHLIERLPQGYDDIKKQLVEIMRLVAYAGNIRDHDIRVDLMLHRA